MIERFAQVGLAIALAVVVAACGTGAPVVDAGEPGPAIVSLEGAPVPMEGLLDVRWASEATSSCTLGVTGDTGGPYEDEPAEGDRSVAVDFAGVDHRPVVTLRCAGALGAVEEELEVPVPYIASFMADPPSVPADGGDVVLCWELAQGEEPLCAIHALPGGEYYYPLAAHDCLFPLRVDVTQEFLLYCSPVNGYVERPLTVPAG